MKNWLKLIGLTDDSKSSRGTLFSRFENIIGDKTDDEASIIVGTAGLLGRVAFSDLNVSESEISGIRDVLLNNNSFKDEGSLNVAMEILSNLVEELSGIEDHHYSRMLRDRLSAEDKTVLLKTLFSVAASDGSITADEEHHLKLISEELLIPRSEYRKVLLEFSSNRSVFQ